MKGHWKGTSWLLVALAGCAAPQPPAFKAPPLDTQLSYFEGSIRSGPTARQPAAERRSDEALSIETTLVYFEHLPTAPLVALPERTEMVMVARGGKLLRPTSELGRTARVGTGEVAQRMRQGRLAGEYGRCAGAAQVLGALPRGVTAVFSAQYPEELRVPGEGTARRRFALQLARAQQPADDELSAALVIEDLGVQGDEGDDEETAPSARVLQREYVLLSDHPRSDGTAFVLGLPTPSLGADSGFLLWVDAREPNALGDRAAAHEAAFARTELELTRVGAEVGALAGELPQSELYRREVGGVFEALDLQRYHRSGLVFLAGSTAAQLAQDFALVAETEALSDYVKTVIEQSKQGEVRSGDAAAVGWLLERSAYIFAANLLDEGKLPGELRACLLAHAGEAGNSSGGLLSAVAECTDLAGFELRLVEDNWISLADTQPAARVRAFDWLVQRGKAPADFDPLGSRETRRASLRKALDAREAPATSR